MPTVHTTLRHIIETDNHNPLFRSPYSPGTKLPTTQRLPWDPVPLRDVVHAATHGIRATDHRLDIDSVADGPRAPAAGDRDAWARWVQGSGPRGVVWLYGCAPVAM